MRLIEKDAVLKEILDMYHAIEQWVATTEDNGLRVRAIESAVTLLDLSHRIENLPLAIEKTGHWKQTKEYPNIIFCDECGEPFEKSNSNDRWNYCPGCGIKMEKSNEID